MVRKYSVRHVMQALAQAYTRDASRRRPVLTRRRKPSDNLCRWGPARTVAGMGSGFPGPKSGIGAAAIVITNVFAMGALQVTLAERNDSINAFSAYGLISRSQ